MSWIPYTEQVRHIVLVSDLHVGARESLLPLDFDDREVGFEFREWLREQWRYFCEEFVPAATNGEPFILVVNGDSIHGSWYKMDPVIKSMTKQTRAAAHVLAPLVALSTKTYIVEGTEVHTGSDECDIAELLSAGGKIIRSDKSAAHRSTSIFVNGLHHKFRHHTSVAGRPWTEASAQGNHLCADRLRMVRQGMPATDILCLAHRHTHGITVTADGMSVVSPAWSAADRYARKASGEDFGIIGGVVFSYANREHKELPDVRLFTKSVAQESVAKPSRNTDRPSRKASVSQRNDKRKGNERIQGKRSFGKANLGKPAKAR